MGRNCADARNALVSFTLRAVGGLMGVLRWLALAVVEDAFRLDAAVFFVEMPFADVFFVFGLEAGVADLLAAGFVVVSAGAAATSPGPCHSSRIDNAITRYGILRSNIPSRSNLRLCGVPVVPLETSQSPQFDSNAAIPFAPVLRGYRNHL
jgi:hypothetical protein